MELAPHNVQKHLGFRMGTPRGHMELLDVAHTYCFLFFDRDAVKMNTHIQTLTFQNRT